MQDFNKHNDSSDGGMDLSQFHGVFFDEAGENLSAMEELLLALDIDEPANDDLHAIFRCAHSIKGGAATFGFADLTELTHVMETLLDRLRRHELVLAPAMIDALLESKDILVVMLGRHAGSSDDPPDASTMAETLRRLSDPAAAAEVLAVGDGAASARASGATPASQAASSSLPGSPDSSSIAPSGGTAPPRLAGQLQLSFASEVSDTLIADALNLFDEVVGLGKIHRYEGVSHRFGIETSTTVNEIADLLGFHLSAGQFSIVLTDADGVDSTAVPASASVPALSPDDVAQLEHDGVMARPAAADGTWGLFVGAAGAPEQPGAATSAVSDTESDDRRVGERRAGAAAGNSGNSGNSGAAGGAKPATGTARGDATLRVSVDKVDQLINLVGELVITQAMLAQTGSELDPMIHQQMVGTLGDLERNTRMLQESVMAIRMIPMSVVFNRFPRMLRDLAKKLDKEVEMVTVGDGTELDKGMIEKITDPLTHLVRNSVDHAIELPADRIAAGKKAAGTITLSAQHRGGSIVIEVRDDGRGLSRRKILAKAAERGLSTSDSMSDEEVWSLIFEPGFSTAEVVTEVSGRGVGMDVVRKNIQALNGSVSITSAEGYGTCVSVRLPLTLAIMDGMSVGLGSDQYILPLDSVIESINLNPRQIKRVSEFSRVLEIRGEYIPILPLEDVVPFEREPGKAGNATVIVFESEGKRVALMVDELIGQHQIVVKNLERNYRKVPGIAGATIMGDGRVALILDVSYLVRRARH